MLRTLLIAFIRLYRFFLGPWLGKQCRFTPTCSLYAIEAIKLHGICQGIKMTTFRLARCQPWSPGGHDHP